MNHQVIEEQQIIDRYLMGKLPEEEEARFEEHYLHCLDCQEALRLGQHMQRGFKVAATQELEAAKTLRQAAFMAWLWRRQGALGAVLMLVLMAVPTTLMWRRANDLERRLQLSEASVESIDAPRRNALTEAGDEVVVGPEQDATEDVSDSTADLTAQLTSQRAAYEQRLQEAQQRNRDLDQALSAARQPSGNTRLIYLGTERSAVSQAPSHRLSLPDAPTWIVLALEVDAGGFESFRGVLYDADDEVIWRGDSLQLDIQDTVNVSVHSSSLKTGDYRLELAGVAASDAEGGARVEAVGTFALRVD